MNSKLSVTLALAALAFAGVVRAQTSAASSGTGLLGQRYAELGVSVLDPRHISDFGKGVDLSVNMPVRTGLDVGYGYGYSRLNAERATVFQQRQRDHSVYGSVTAYTTWANVKPFVGAALGYQWSKYKLDFGGVNVIDRRDDEAVWGLGTGVEIPLGAVTLTPKILYQDGFKGDSAAAFNYSTEASMWFTPKVGGFAEVGFVDPTGGGIQSWSYRVGARFRF